MIQSGNKQQNQIFLDTPFVPITRITSSRPFNLSLILICRLIGLYFQ